MDNQEDRLKHLLTAQPFTPGDGLQQALERRQRQAQACTELLGGIAVLSHFPQNTCYIYSGTFGRLIGIGRSPMVVASAFEDQIFSCIPPDDLVERHALELSYYHFQQTVDTARRADWHAVCLVRFRLSDGTLVPVLHRTCYLESLPNGSVWLGLCLYTPWSSGDGQPAVTPHIIDHATGATVAPDECLRLGQQLLSPREREVLALLAQGLSSKQVAQRLCIATNTVLRHRQNILAALHVGNTAMAVQVAMRLRLI